MAITIILICLAIQRWFAIDHYERQSTWFEYYYHWMKDRFGELALWSAWPGMVLIILPPVLAYCVIAFLVDRLTGMIGYYLLTLLVFGYVLDARSFAAEPIETSTASQLLTSVYQRIFAIIFWLSIVGSAGVVLYILVVYLCRCLQKMPDDSQAQQLLSRACKVQGILDWVPLRLLGLTYALIGQFAVTFALWYQNLLTGIAQGREQMVFCGLTALGFNRHTSQQTLTPDQRQLLEGLIERALWVWLVVIALFTIGRWLG